jgi:hypothetical protein
MGFSLLSLSKLKSPLESVAASPARTPIPRYSSRDEKKKLDNGKILFQRNAPTEAEVQQDYSPYAMELWKTSDYATIAADDAGCVGKYSDYGRADEIVENTRGTNPQYDLRRPAAPVRRPGGELTSLANIQAQHQEDHGHIALFAGGAESFQYEVLFDAEDDDAAPVITVDDVVVIEQFKRLLAEPEGEQCYDAEMSYNANRSLDYGVYGVAVAAAVDRILDCPSEAYKPYGRVCSEDLIDACFEDEEALSLGTGALLISACPLRKPFEA